MKNEEENFEQAGDTAQVTPPPFRQNEEKQPAQPEPTASPTLTERLKALGLDEGATEQLTRLAGDIPTEDISDDLLATLARGVAHDEDVQNADAAGYLRGRNEKIEAVLHPQPQDEDDEHNATPVFPRYCRRSIWE